MALSLPALAQQSIQFSQPAKQDPAANANAVLPPSSHSSAGAFNAPGSLFGGNAGPDFDLLPGGPAPVTQNASPQWQRFLDDKRNWTLLTPEEVLGLPTPEKILGITDPDEDQLSAQDRYLRRQERRSETTVTNNVLRQTDSLLWHPDDPSAKLFQEPDAEGRMPETSRNSLTGRTPPGSTRSLSPIFNPLPKSPTEMNPDIESTWVSPFNVPDQVPKPSPEQLAGMDRFRALMEAPAADKPSLLAGFSAQPLTAPDPNMQLPAFNPAGGTIKQLQSDIAAPTGLLPLTPVTGQLPPPPKKAAMVQSPPWMSSSPQNAALPQRQF
jgi:hypothetical protein